MGLQLINGVRLQLINRVWLWLINGVWLQLVDDWVRLLFIDDSLLFIYYNLINLFIYSFIFIIFLIFILFYFIFESEHVFAGQYPHVAQLLALESQAAIFRHTSCAVQGFLPLREWLPFLSSMPDQDLAGFLERAIRWGFAIGFKPGSALEPSTSNVSSVTDVVSKYIAEKVAAGRLRPPPTVTQTGPALFLGAST